MLNWSTTLHSVIHVDVDDEYLRWHVHHRGGGESRAVPYVLVVAARFIFDTDRLNAQRDKVERWGGRLGLHAWVEGQVVKSRGNTFGRAGQPDELCSVSPVRYSPGGFVRADGRAAPAEADFAIFPDPRFRKRVEILVPDPTGPRLRRDDPLCSAATDPI